jgi:hypothetical protein
MGTVRTRGKEPVPEGTSMSMSMSMYMNMDMSMGMSIGMGTDMGMGITVVVGAVAQSWCLMVLLVCPACLGFRVHTFRLHTRFRQA